MPVIGLTLTIQRLNASYPFIKEWHVTKRDIPVSDTVMAQGTFKLPVPWAKDPINVEIPSATIGEDNKESFTMSIPTFLHLSGKDVEAAFSSNYTWEQTWANQYVIYDGPRPDYNAEIHTINRMVVTVQYKDDGKPLAHYSEWCVWFQHKTGAKIDNLTWDPCSSVGDDILDLVVSRIAGGYPYIEKTS